METLVVKLDTVRIKKSDGFPFMYGKRRLPEDYQEWSNIKVLCGGVTVKGAVRVWWYTAQIAIEPSGKFADNNWLSEDQEPTIKVGDIVTIRGIADGENNHGTRYKKVRLMITAKEGAGKVEEEKSEETKRPCPTCGSTSYDTEE